MTKSFLRVEKIGGTSMSRFQEVMQNVLLINPKDVSNRIIVVSAYDGVTNALLEHKKTRQPGVYTLFSEQKDFVSIPIPSFNNFTFFAQLAHFSIFLFCFFIFYILPFDTIRHFYHE